MFENLTKEQREEVVRVMYSEENSFFSHEGKDYPINPVFEYTRNSSIDLIDVDELSWIFKFSFPDMERQSKVDIQIPIIITIYDNKFLVVDGLHRLSETMFRGINQIKSKFIPINKIIS